MVNEGDLLYKKRKMILSKIPVLSVTKISITFSHYLQKILSKVQGLPIEKINELNSLLYHFQKVLP